MGFFGHQAGKAKADRQDTGLSERLPATEAVRMTPAEPSRFDRFLPVLRRALLSVNSWIEDELKLKPLVCPKCGERLR